MKGLKCVIREIESVVGRSSVEEDPLHSKNTLEWVLRLAPSSDPAIEIAALGHDIERAIDDRKVKRTDFQGYDSFKSAHAKNSAIILREIMARCGIEDESFVRKVAQLVELHEFGGTPEADILKDADGISFFHVNLPFYYRRNGREEAVERCRWGYRRLSKRARDIVKNLSFDDSHIHEIVNVVIKDSQDLSS